MIRTKDKILAEPNDPNTVLSMTGLTTNGLIRGVGNKAVADYTPSNSKVLIVSRKDGSLYPLHINKPNVVIGTNSEGEITLYDRSDV